MFSELRQSGLKLLQNEGRKHPLFTVMGQWILSQSIKLYLVDITGKALVVTRIGVRWTVELAKFKDLYNCSQSTVIKMSKWWMNVIFSWKVLLKKWFCVALTGDAMFQFGHH